VPAPPPAVPARDTETARAVPASPLDPEIESVVRLRASHPGPLSYAALLAHLGRLGKPVRAYAYTATRGWTPLAGAVAEAGAVVEIGIQLVDRKGPLSAAQLSACCDALYSFAAEHGGAVTCPDVEASLALARELDTFCVSVDMLIGVNVVAPEGMPFMVRRIDEQARAAGMSLNREGVYVMADDAGRPLYSLANYPPERFTPEDATQTAPSVTLLFDVPNVADGLAVFDRMTRFGFELARGLGGRLMDDHGHTVTEASLQSDRRQLDGFYQRMRERGIAAGSVRAQRLFA
jgi:hypothetical protein